MAAANSTKAAFYAVITPYLDRIYESSPDFGSAGFTLTFHDGQITRIDITETVQRKIAPRDTRAEGQP